MPIIEEWTAWVLVRERERELAHRERVREAERARIAQAREVVRLRPRTDALPSERPPRRRAA